MSLFDFFLIVILFGAGVLGYKRGIIVQIASFLSTLIGLFIALLFVNEVAPIVAKWFSSKNTDSWVEISLLDKSIYSTIAFFFLFLMTKLLLSFFTFLFYRLAKFPFLKKYHRLGGILFSLLQTVLIFVFVIHVMHLIPFKSLHNLVEDSFIAQQLITLTPFLMRAMEELFIG